MHNGFYDELIEMQKTENPEATWEYLQVDNTYGMSDVPPFNDCGFSLYDFLHGYCTDFANYMHTHFGYQIEVLSNQYDEIVHAYCFTDIKGKKIYIDIRGCTDDWNEFVREFDDFIEYEKEPVRKELILWKYDDEFTEKMLQDSLDIHAAKAIDDIMSDYKDIYVPETITI